MDFTNLIVSPGLAAAGVAALGLVGLTVWWLVRKRQQRLWLPTIRIMQLESRILPRLVFRLPPLLSFLCFLTATLVLLGFALKPRTQVFTPFEPNQTRIHIFCDLSPSVAARVSIEDYAGKMAALYQSLKDKGRISLSTSAGPEVSEPQSADAVAELIRSTGFHRGGLRLGSALKQLLEQRGDVDRLFVVSDRDQHSWTGFNWRYLLDEMDVVFYDLAGQDSESLVNVFINDARFLSSPLSPTMDWDVEVARRTPKDAGDSDGRLEVTYMGKSVGTFPWKIPAGKQRINVRAEWPASLISEIDPAGARDVPLVFRVEVDGGDALAADNEFRAGVLGMKQDVMLVSEASGERLLEDSAEQLEVALEIQGFRLKRYDYITQPGPAPDDFPFVVLLGGAEGGVDRFCPSSLETARLAERAKQGAKNGRQRALPKVWLAPQSLNANWRDMCRCYSRLLLSTSAGAPEPAFCSNVETRAGWIGLLPSLGAKQVGGEIGEGSKSLAWHAKDQASGLDVLAFTVPLMPMKETGINHAEMPILIKELLTWQGILEPRGGAATSWPRVEDIAALTWQPQHPVEPAELARLRSTNVPLGESLLQSVEAAQLPPRWTAQMDSNTKQLPAKKDREDPLPWLKLAALIVVFVSALEGVLGLGSRLMRFVTKRPETAAVLLCLLLGALAQDKAFAKVEFNLVGYHEGAFPLSMLAREVGHRTSIEVEAKANQFGQVTPESLSEPWLWVKDMAAVTTPAGTLRPDVALWLKRGGFLILESPEAPPQLAKLTEELKDGGEGAGWNPLPPDHELMRSFYLLDALPSCNGEIWRGFHYDGRLAVLALPYGFLSSLKDGAPPPQCANPPDQERSVRVFVNLIMVALATDYKKDQIHLPEILKRLR